MTDPNRLLSCKHKRRVALKLGGDGIDVYCRFHGWVTVIETQMKEYHAMCENCSWARWGTYASTNRDAGKHKATHRDHRIVTVTDTHTRDGRGEYRTTHRPERTTKDSHNGLCNDPEGTVVFDYEVADSPPPF